MVCALTILNVNPLGAALLAAVLIIVPMGASASGNATFSGPRLTTAVDRMTSAVSCSSGVGEAARPTPVLLVHGSGGTSREAWAHSYQPSLTARGHAVCTVDLPAFGVGDVQVSTEYVVHAIRRVHALAGRPISVIGLSKGAFEIVLAMRMWRDLASKVDDVVGLAGVYDLGSQTIATRCDTRGACVPAFHQIRAGSPFLQAVRSWPLPAGPSYTLLGSRQDRTVTPQPAANAMPGALSLMVEDVCPSRGVSVTHGMFVGDAVAHALALDALDHPGRADRARLDPAVCEKQYYDAFDEEGHRAAQVVRSYAETATAPAVRCYYLRNCSDASSRGRLIRDVEVRVRASRIVVRAAAVRPGTIELRLAGKRVVRKVIPGQVRLRIARPVTRTARMKTLRVRTDLPAYTAWAPEHRTRVPARSQRQR